MKAIVNVNRDWAIGRRNDLLVFIPEDMKFFRSTTKGKVVVMGRKTLESFPGKKPLKGRVNIVLTRDASRIPQEARNAAISLPAGDIRRAEAREAGAEPATILVTVSSAEELRTFLREAEKAGWFTEEDVYVIGGSSIYRDLLPLCDTCLVTVNDYRAPEDDPADAWFPNLDELPEWTLAEKGEEKEWEGIRFRFCTYRKS